MYLLIKQSNLILNSTENVCALHYHCALNLSVSIKLNQHL